MQSFVSFVEMGILCFYFDPISLLPVAIKKAVGWTFDQNDVMFSFQHGRQSCCWAQTDEA